MANGSSTSITELPGLRSAFSKFATVAISERDDSKSICDNEEAKCGPTAWRPWSTFFQPFVTTIWKMGKNFVFGCVLVFFSRKIRYHKELSEWVEWYIILKTFNCDSNDIKYKYIFTASRKNRFEFFDFWSNF